MRYYPEAGLLYYKQDNGWVKVSPDDRTFLEAAIAQAVQQRALGELELGPIAADFRARHMAEAGYWLRPVALTAAPGYMSPASCQSGCASLGPSIEQFIMHDLVATVSRAPRGPSQESPAFAIEYYGSFGGGGIGGLLGYYTPPADGQLGRFWTDGYFYDKSAPYYETTVGFDTSVSRALDRGALDAALGDTPASSGTSGAGDSQGGGSISLSLLVAAAAALTALVAGSGFLYARRTHAGRAQ
jgi:hypothetical protein